MALFKMLVFWVFRVFTIKATLLKFLVFRVIIIIIIIIIYLFIYLFIYKTIGLCC
jgi:hypothetical protein